RARRHLRRQVLREERAGGNAEFDAGFVREKRLLRLHAPARGEYTVENAERNRRRDARASRSRKALAVARGIAEQPAPPARRIADEHRSVEPVAVERRAHAVAVLVGNGIDVALAPHLHAVRQYQLLA